MVRLLLCWLSIVALEPGPVVLMLLGSRIRSPVTSPLISALKSNGRAACGSQFDCRRLSILAIEDALPLVLLPAKVLPATVALPVLAVAVELLLIAAL